MTLIAHSVSVPRGFHAIGSRGKDSRFLSFINRPTLRCACRADAPAAPTRGGRAAPTGTPRTPRTPKRGRGGRPREARLSPLSDEQASFFRRHRELPPPRESRVSPIRHVYARQSIPILSSLLPLPLPLFPPPSKVTIFRLVLSIFPRSSKSRRRLQCRRPRRGRVF